MHLGDPNHHKLSESRSPGFFSRRQFLRSAAIVGAVGTGGCSDGLTFKREGFPQKPGSLPPGDGPRLAIVGCGEASHSLMRAIGLIEDPAVRPSVIAVVDLLATAVFHLSGWAQSYGHPGRRYRTLEEMLTAEQGKLDAVIIATPDFLHHEQTIRCLHAGLHVYCEEPMSNRIEWAREMVKAAKQTGKILQVGSDRRSHPRYVDLRDRIIAKHHGLGMLQHASARHYFSPYSLQPLHVRGSSRAEEVAVTAGYLSFHEMRNWRFFRERGLGVVGKAIPYIDTLNAILQCAPRRIAALGFPGFLDHESSRDGSFDFSPGKLIAQFEYDLPRHLHPLGETSVVTASIEIMEAHALSKGFESFHGEFVALHISDLFSANQIQRRAGGSVETGKKLLEKAIENPKSTRYPHSSYDIRSYLQDKAWRSLIEEGVIEEIPSDDTKSARKPWEMPRRDRIRKPYERTAHERLEEERNPGKREMIARNAEPSVGLWEYRLANTRELPPGQPHLLNFLQAVHSGDASSLRCPPEEGFRTCVTALKVLEAVETGNLVELGENDFTLQYD